MKRDYSQSQRTVVEASGDKEVQHVKIGRCQVRDRAGRLGGRRRLAGGTKTAIVMLLLTTPT
jgi:hypothetical protein